MRTMARVSSAPTASEGAKASANVRAGPARSDCPDRPAFRATATSDNGMVTPAAASQIASRCSGPLASGVRTAAIEPITPDRIIPAPETAVKRPARTMVSRMNASWSAARSARADGGVGVGRGMCFER